MQGSDVMHDHEPAGQRGYSATGALYWAARRVWAGDLSTPDERNTNEFETPTDGGVEYASEAVADALGLNDSQYQWVIDQYMKEKELEEQERLEEEEERAAAAEGLEEGSAVEPR